jgi:CheY-like chemotaxis protein
VLQILAIARYCSGLRLAWHPISSAKIAIDCAPLLTTARNATEGLAALQNGDFDVLPSDIGMPGEAGFSLIEKVRKLEDGNGAIPAASITAFARSQDRERALLAGYARIWSSLSSLVS